VRTVAVIDHAGRRLTHALQYMASIWTMVYVSLRSGVVGQKHQSFIEILKVISSQIYFTGYQALPIVSMLALITGTLIIIQTSAQLSKVGGGEMLGNLLVVLIIRELGPLITALVVIARSGTAVASELGNMKVNSEIEALESMGINPLSYIVFPRLVGGIVSVVCLAFYFCILALFGGYFMAQVVHPIAFSFYVDSISYAVSRADVLLFLAKNFFSGAAIFVICCHQGLQVKQSFTEVPQVTTKAVVNSILTTVSFSAVVSFLVYLQNLKNLGIL
jgi:phospholipid/cholesterol/gamma-HCH transport system permease protein